MRREHALVLGERAEVLPVLVAPAEVGGDVRQHQGRERVVARGRGGVTLVDVPEGLDCLLREQLARAAWRRRRGGENGGEVGGGVKAVARLDACDFAAREGSNWAKNMRVCRVRTEHVQ